MDESRPLVQFAGLERLGEGAMVVFHEGHRFDLRVGPEGVRLEREGQLVGRSGWEALAAFLGQQQRRLETLIGSRPVPRTLLDHPEFEALILPCLYVNAYEGDRLVRGGTRRRLEARVADLQEAERLMRVEIACANPECLHVVRPFRPRAKGAPTRLFVGFTCPIEESIACARTRGAKEAMEAVVVRVEAAGQYSANDIQRR
ncbi:MAG: hypothetical protein VKQ33_05180 [Candidatus Sericytochromatia bacterium]|nr:hypothetical protein [Candidatus Sericytochromatia bacterium]